MTQTVTKQAKVKRGQVHAHVQPQSSQELELELELEQAQAQAQQQQQQETPEHERQRLARILFHRTNAFTYEMFLALTRDQDTYDEATAYLKGIADRAERLRNFRHFLEEDSTMGCFRKACQNKGIPDSVQAVGDDIDALLAIFDVCPRPDEYAYS